MGVRTFLALDLDEAIRQRLADAQRQIDDPGAKIKWVAPELLHVTMKFLGEVDDAAVANVCELAAGVAALHEPFDFDVRGVTCVPPGGRSALRTR